MKQKKKIPKRKESKVRFESVGEDSREMEDLFENLKIIKFSDKDPPPVQNKRRTSSAKSGFSKPDEVLDLHGKTRAEAIMMVQNFIMTGFQRKLSALLIITGRGLHSEGEGPILNDAVRQWLDKNGRSYFREYFTAPPKFGGDGAIWIDLA